MANGTMESCQLINWGKVFLATLLFSTNQGSKSIELLKQTIEEFVKALNNDELHPFLETLYQSLGNMAIKLNMQELALKNYRKLMACKQKHLGEHHREVIGPMMQVQQCLNFLAVQGEFEQGIEMSKKTIELVDMHVNEIDNKLVMQAGSLEKNKQEELENEMEKLNNYKLDCLFNLHNLHKLQYKYEEALGFAHQYSELNLQLHKRNHKSYAYALMLETQCMQKITSFD